MSTESLLTKLYYSAQRYSLDNDTKIVCMSDCHRGMGNHGDNFLANQHLFYAALEYYYDNCFVYVEMGDGDELWENRNLKRIFEIHNDSIWLMSEFYKKGRFHMLYGNHDRKKRNPRYMAEYCLSLTSDSDNKYCGLIKGLSAKEGIVLEDRETGRHILLVHGHQGDLINDKLWLLGRFLVRYVWRPLELEGFSDPTDAGKNYKLRNKTEKRLAHWAEKTRVMVIAGHTHRAVLPKDGGSLYLNDGSCVHPRCITAIEIQNMEITLVKWLVMVRHNSVLSVEREILEGPVSLDKFW
jgi:predicted phosphodiesterase